MKLPYDLLKTHSEVVEPVSPRPFLYKLSRQTNYRGISSRDPIKDTPLIKEGKYDEEKRSPFH